MSDQVSEDPEVGESSYEADLEAGQDEDSDDTAGVAGSDTSGERAATSHEADIASGFDDSSGRNRPSGDAV